MIILLYLFYQQHFDVKLFCFQLIILQKPSFLKCLTLFLKVCQVWFLASQTRFILPHQILFFCVEFCVPQTQRERRNCGVSQKQVNYPDTKY